MVGHIRYPGIDQNRPASLSSEIIGGWLRSDLGFSGVVITDDLAAMRGVSEQGTMQERAVDAIDAGVDLVLFVAHDEIAEIVTAIVERASADPSFLQRIDESLERVLRLKASFGLVAPLNPEQFPQNRC